ncbi:ATP-binding protein [Streptomyces sp. NPDC018031]|uniref:sensor histidine kinase n=1 Tax=Streptomyces sp. NPDC018031 TaxID=3365033 RepID=UPI00378B4AEC
MVHVGTPPGGRRPLALPWLLPPAVVAVCVAVAVALSPDGARAPVAWCGAAATLAVAIASGEAIRRGRTITALRARRAEQDAAFRHRLADQQTEMVRLAKELLPTAVERLQRGELAEEVLRDLECEIRLDADFEAAHHEVLRAVVRTVEAEEALRDAAQRAFVNIARRVQALVHQQAMDLRDMEDKHGNNPDVFTDLLHIDHGTALIGRLADSIAVLGGARPGRQWQKEVPLYNVLRGAMSRIIDYRRVDLHSVADVAIVGPAVEPVIHAVAELLDNATRYSPPQTRVHLTATEVQTGVAIEIEDAGVGLTDEAAKRTDRLLARGSGGLDLDDLGEAPRLGLAVVGRLAGAYDFKVSLRRSAYGGVRAVLVVAQDLTAPTPAPGGMVARAATLPPPKLRVRPLATPPAAPPDEGPAPVPGDGGLPQRRRRFPAPPPGRRRPAAPAAPVAPVAPPAPAPVADREPPPGMWLSAFLPGDASGRTPAHGSGHPDHDDS